MGSSSSKNNANDDSMELDVVHEDLFEEKEPAFAIPKDLGEALRRPKMRNQFREFLRRSLALENLLFFETIELYQKIEREKWRELAGRQMIEKFLSSQSLYQVNLSSETAQQLRDTIAFELDTFDKAKREIFQLMNENFFDRFIDALKMSELKMKEEQKRKAQEEAQAQASRSTFGRIRRASSASLSSLANRLLKKASNASISVEIDTEENSS